VKEQVSNICFKKIEHLKISALIWKQQMGKMPLFTVDGGFEHGRQNLENGPFLEGQLTA
jgi:hypothetical protein